MKRFPRGVARIGAAVGLAGTIALGVALPASAAAVSNAYAVKANVLSGLVNVEPTPLSTFPSGGAKSVASVNLGTLGSVKVLNAATKGDSTAGTSSATASVADVKLGLGPLVLTKNSGVSPSAAAQVTSNAAAISADAITASCDANGGTVSGNANLVNVRLGDTVLNAHPGINSEVGIPGVLSVKLNEQSKKDGVLTVDAVHIRLLAGKGADIVLGHALCGPNAPEEGSPIVTKGFLGGFGVLVLAGAGAFAVRRRRVGSAV
jgi:MYXO-CTERM domain-containing protein